MKLECREIWVRVSRIKLRVSPRAGATKTREGPGTLFSGSVSGSIPSGFNLGVAGVPGLGVPEYVSFLPDIVNATMGCPLVWPEKGKASLSIVNAKKSSCCSLRCFRMVSKTVATARSEEQRTAALSDRASWNRNLQPGSSIRDSREGKCMMQGPDSSSAALRIPKAIRRVESVCC